MGEVGLSQRHREELEWLVHDGESAKDRMTRANLRLVVVAARKYSIANKARTIRLPVEKVENLRRV